MADPVRIWARLNIVVPMSTDSNASEDPIRSPTMADLAEYARPWNQGKYTASGFAILAVFRIARVLSHDFLRGEAMLDEVAV